MNASKGAITPVQNIKAQDQDPSLFAESLHHDLSVSNLDIFTDNTNASHRISRQGNYAKIVKAAPIAKTQDKNHQQSTTAYTDNNYKARKDNRPFHQKKQSQISVGKAKVITSNVKPSQQELSQEQIRLLKRLNHNFNQTGNDINDEDEINSMIEEQIERESGAPGTAKSRMSRGDTKRRGTAGYGKQRTDLGSGNADEEDEYDVDYDNLVVSDILGVSGIPQGMGGVFGTFGIPQSNNHGGNKNNLAQSFSLYDFS